jgi:RNA polymerase sigma-54 factor
MVLLQNKLNLRVSQKQILTPGLVQMVSVLALNKLELREMINTEMVENPVLEELDSSVPLLDEIAGREEAHERQDALDIKEKETETAPEADKKDPFDEIDFGSFFKDYLDPGYRNSADLEEIDRPSFENFLSKPGTLTDHLLWQLGAITVRPTVRAAAELVIGNLNEDGYLTASEDELMGVAHAKQPEEASSAEAASGAQPEKKEESAPEPSHLELVVSHEPAPEAVAAERRNGFAPVLQFTREDLREAIALIQQFDPAAPAQNARHGWV